MATSDSKAIFDLCQSIAGSLRDVVSFDALGLVLHDPVRNELCLHVISKLQNESKAVVLPAESDSVFALVWREQKPRVLSCIETEAPEGDVCRLAFGDGIRALTLIPVSDGHRRLGILGFGFRELHQPDDRELKFQRRVATEFAGAVDGYLTKLALQQERARIHVLFDITTALTSKLPMDELFRAISEQLG